MIEKVLKKLNNKIVTPPKIGQLADGTIIEKGNNIVFFDLGPQGIGVIYGRELLKIKDIIKKLDIGEKVLLRVTNLEDEETGYREVFLAQVKNEDIINSFLNLKDSQEFFEAEAVGANRGGLLFNIKKEQAFLPASQLLPEHYPKVEDGDPQKILNELQKFIGKKLKVRVLNILPDGKIILTEKPVQKETTQKTFQVGDIIKGEISGITNFGAFMKFGDNIEGLIYPDEIPNLNGKQISEVLKLNQKVKAKIIKIEEGRIYLTLKI
ncbi:MAG: S1 RNA-binding domain-containing protein [Minisyncoccia bacterium]